MTHPVGLSRKKLQTGGAGLSTAALQRPDRGAAESRPRGSVSSVTVAAYAVAAFSTMLIAQPINIYLPQIYAKELGIGLGALGAVLVITQLVDAVSQQVCGMLSDRTRTRFGARKPWIAAGATLAIFAAYFLLRPPPGVGLMWFLAWKLVYDFAWTAKNIAYSAWGSELANGYQDRSRIIGSAGFAGQVGNLCNDLLPIVVFWLGLTSSSAYSMQVMGYYFVAGAIAVPVCHAISLIFAPAGVAQPKERPNILGMIGSVRGNRPFWRYLLSFTLSGLGIGVVSLNFTFYDGYLRVGQWFPYMMTAFAVTIMLSIPMWVWAANRLGKHRAYTISMFIGGLAPMAFWFVNPDTVSQSAVIALGTGVVMLIGLGVGCNFVTTASILGDIVDYDTLRNRTTRTASYFAFHLLVTKVSMAVGSGLAFMTVAAFGYDAKAGATNDDMAKLGILITVTLAPAILKCTAGAIMWNYPIDARRHGVIQRRLAQRASRQEAVA